MKVSSASVSVPVTDRTPSTLIDSFHPVRSSTHCIAGTVSRAAPRLSSGKNHKEDRRKNRTRWRSNHTMTPTPANQRFISSFGGAAVRK